MHCCEQEMIELPLAQYLCKICYQFKTFMPKVENDSCCYPGSIASGYCTVCEQCFIDARKVTYRVKYHLGEILNRITCKEKNKPCSKQIELIKQKLYDNFTIENIYKHTNYTQRKHLAYIYCTLNDRPYLNLSLADEKFIRTCFSKIMHSDLLTNRKNMFNNYLILHVISRKYNFNNMREYIYFKETNNTKKIYAYLYRTI